MYDLTVKVDADADWRTVATATQQAEAGRLAKIDGIAKLENEIALAKRTGGVQRVVDQLAIIANWPRGAHGWRALTARRPAQ